MERPINLETFSMRLSRLRMNKGISAREMSLAIGQNPGYINNIELGKAYPTMNNFLIICEYLGITPSEFFDFESAKPAVVRVITRNLKKLTPDQLQSIAVIVESLARNNR